MTIPAGVETQRSRRLFGGSLRVSLNSIALCPQEWGAGGVESNRLIRTPRKQDKYATALSVPPWVSKILGERYCFVPSQMRIAMVK